MGHQQRDPPPYVFTSVLENAPSSRGSGVRFRVCDGKRTHPEPSELLPIRRFTRCDEDGGFEREPLTEREQFSTAAATSGSPRRIAS
jgi:hypothetical protein